MSTDRFERALPDLLEQLAPRAVPDYRDDIVRQTARMRQRPAWIFPERWFPVSVITSRALTAPPIRWRIVVLVALLLLALAVSLAIVAGSQPHVPAPFGPAANGVVAYEAGGDIFTADPATGAAKALITDAQMNLRPVFSGDGTHVVFEQKAAGLPKTATEQERSSVPSRLIVARSDGSDQVVLTPDPLDGFDAYPAATAQYAFSPDGTAIAFWSTPAGGGKVSIANADGSAIRQLDLPMTVSEAAYAPPNGTELIVAGTMTGGTNGGIYAVDAKTGAARTIVAPAAGVGVGFIRVSPGGSRLAYVSSVDSQDQGPGPEKYRVHVVGLDGTNDLTLPLTARATFQDSPAWSNDGTRLAITRGYAQHNEDMALAVVPADGSGVGVESAHGLTGCCNTILQWSPDDTSILVTPDTNLGGVSPEHLLLDPSTGTAVPAPWTGSSPPAWQRVVR